MRSHREEMSRRGKLVPMAVLMAATILFAVWALVFHHHNLAVFIVGHYPETLALLPTLTLLGLLTIVVTIDAYIRPELKQIMRFIIAVVFSLVIQDHLEYRLMVGEARPMARTLAAIYGYAVRPVALVLFMRMIAPHKRLRWAWALVGVNAAVYLTALFSDVCFYISWDNHYIPGPLSDTGFYVGAVLFICYIIMTMLPSAPQAEKLRVQCFGCFEVFWHGEPLMFARRHTKELFAYLVNRRGATCTTEDVISALWGEVSDLKNAKHRVRNYIGDLRETLKGIGMEDVLIRRGQNIAIRTDLLDCDYYHMLDSDVEAIKTYRDDFMPKYSWAEPTTGTLYFRSNP